ncbi:MAG: hypothetical protein ABSF32_03485 [Ignavibacteria bacterium]|jgi:hypothetical protein
MYPSSSLFNLIKSLSKSEKRYFRMYSSLQEGNKNYLKLFDTIDKMPQYDESFIKHEFKKEKFTKQLTFTKNYLHSLIFKSLYSYYSKHSIENRLNDLIFRCSYYYKKTLYKDFINTIQLGKKLSSEYERFGYFIQFSSFEKILITEKLFPSLEESSILTQEELVTEKIGNLSVYDSYVAMLTGIYRTEGKTRDTVLFKYIERIRKSPLLTSEDYALSYLAKERYYYLLQIISDICGKYDDMFYYCKKRLDIISSHPEPFTDRIYNYWGDILMNLILISIRCNRSRKIIEYLHLLESHIYDTKSDKVYLFLVQSYLSVQLIITEKRWDRIHFLMERIKIGLNIYKGIMDPGFELVLYDLIVRMYVEASDHGSALKYMNLLLNHPLISIRRDIEYNARLLNLIIHYELKNFDYLEYLILSTYRFLYKRKKIYKLETLVIDFIKRLPRINSNRDLAENFQILQNNMRTIYKKPHEKNIFLYFNYMEWVSKKLKEIR